MTTPEVSAGGQPYPVTLEDGQVRVHLPFRVDTHQLSSQLVREGYGIAHQPDTPDTQGWGPEFSANGYYPYWVYPDPANEARSCFAFYPNPEDAVSRGTGDPIAVTLGERSQETVNRWVPVLTRLRGEQGGGPQ